MEKGRTPGVGARVRNLRKALGLTQQQLAQRLHVKQATVSDYENGKLQLDADELPHVAQALGVQVADLFVDEQPYIALSTEDLMALLSQRVRGIESAQHYAESPTLLHAKESANDAGSVRPSTANNATSRGLLLHA